jgi:hypothetical protein
MSTSRNVVVASSAANKAKKFSTSATTLGELKAQSEMSGLAVGEVEYVVKPGNVTLRDDDSTLPTGDFKLYIIPTKNKAGTVSPSQAQQLGKDIAQAIADAASKVETNELSELKADLIEVIEDFFGVTLEDCPECNEALAEARRM